MSQKQFLTFMLSGQEYGIDALKVIEVINPVSVTNVPMADQSVIGIMNFRGEVIPLIDLAYLMNLESSTLNGKIVVISHKDSMYGLMVDMVREIISPQNYIEASELGEVQLPFLQSVTQTQTGLVRLLDIDAALDSLVK
jgi:purine-binding chemotaxis protein CheW